MPKRYADHSQHANTSNPEYTTDPAGDHCKLRLHVHWHRDPSDGLCYFTLAASGPVESTDRESMYHPGAWRGFPLDPNDVVWPSPDYPVDADGRGLSVLDVKHRTTTVTPRAA